VGCHLFEEENAMMNFELNTHIHRPLTQVFSFVATPENDFQWQYGTLTSAQVSQGEVGIGTLFRVVGHLMGQRLETLYEVTTFELNRCYGFRSVTGPVDSHIHYRFEITDGATRIQMTLETDLRDLFKASNTIIIKRFKKQYKENLAMLKSILEAQKIVRA
jgi:hypothetical protein